jgi:hypothetical protein
VGSAKDGGEAESRNGGKSRRARRLAVNTGEAKESRAKLITRTKIFLRKVFGRLLKFSNRLSRHPIINMPLNAHI